MSADKEWFSGAAVDEAEGCMLSPLRWLLGLWLLALGLLAWSCAQAETWATASLASYHMERRGYCEANPGAGLEHGIVVVGLYRNSFCQASAYAGLKLPLARHGAWSLGAAAIVVTGYEKSLTPALGAVLSFERLGWGANLVWFPNEKGQMERGVIGLQVKRRFR